MCQAATAAAASQSVPIYCKTPFAITCLQQAPAHYVAVADRQQQGVLVVALTPWQTWLILWAASQVKATKWQPHCQQL
jgi:hypothetical protein